MREGERLAAEVARLAGQSVPRRDWRRVRWSGGCAAAMLVASLIAGELLRMPRLEAFCFLTGVATGAVMLMYAFDRRLFIVRSSAVDHQQPRPPASRIVDGCAGRQTAPRRK